MNHTEPLEQSSQDPRPQDPPREEPREWIEPTFERMTLKEAMAGFLFGTIADAVLYFS